MMRTAFRLSPRRFVPLRSSRSPTSRTSPRVFSNSFSHRSIRSSSWPNRLASTLCSSRGTKRGAAHGVFSMSELERQVRDCSLRWTDHVDRHDTPRRAGARRTTARRRYSADVLGEVQKRLQYSSLVASASRRALWGVIEQLGVSSAQAAGQCLYHARQWGLCTSLGRHRRLRDAA